MAKLTVAKVREAVRAMAREVQDGIKEGYSSREEPHDAIFGAVDSAWGDLVTEGRIDAWPVNPGAEVMQNLSVIMEVAEADAWVEDDPGLWDGLHGAAVLGSMAFFSLQNCLWEELRRRGAID